VHIADSGSFVGDKYGVAVSNASILIKYKSDVSSENI